jgi:hypothetical protein
MLTVLGNILIGVVGSCIAALILGPILTTPWSYWFVIAISKLLSWTSSDFTGAAWTLTWHVESENFQPANPSPLRLQRFFNVVGAEWDVVATNGASYSYRLVGQLNDGKLTGRWFDADNGRLGYSGVMQLVFSPLGDSAAGLWIGYSAANNVKSGEIVLKDTSRSAN